MTLTGLNPDTGYIVRVAIYKDYETRTLGKSTGVIEVRTASEWWGFFRLQFLSQAHVRILTFRGMHTRECIVRRGRLHPGL